MSIYTLIPDIYYLLEKEKSDWFTEIVADDLSHSTTRRLREQLGKQEEQKPRLRLSRMGPSCPRAFWYSFHHPELAEELPPWATFKYSYGHIIEALAISLAKASGHLVEGEQDVLTVDGVEGHRDCVIDGCVVDVKSVASRSFIKFKDKTLAQDDSFGYLDQLDGYLVGSASDPLVTVKDKAYIWAIDKQMGHMTLYEHFIRPDRIRDRIARAKSIVALSEPPKCECGTTNHGESGNVALDVKASYSQHKFECFPHLRTFLYSNGPVYLTKVVKRPTNKFGPITEIDRYGKVVHSS